jgi:two-component system, NtrC family, sensor kinase
VRLLRDTPIRRKLTAITMVTSGVALLLACLAFVGYEVIVFRGSMVEELTTTAAIIGDNSSAALMFDDPRSAEQTLRSLNTHPHVIGAAIYTREGKLFARYARSRVENRFVAPPLRLNGHDFADDRLELFHSFQLAGEHAGTVYIESDLTELHARIARYILIGICVLIISSAVAFLLAARLQRTISGPISHLAGVMNLVKSNNDYAVRAEKRGEDELGSLIDGFNSMLDQIRAQDNALTEARNHLEARVVERTRELERTHQQLVEASRQAGMAEVATNVLHNVGNVLNSVNVSASVITDQIERSKASGLSRLVALLDEHRDDLGRYIANDPRGRHVPAYLSQLSEHLQAERDSNLKELVILRKSIDHINEIVAMQQSYSKVSGVTQAVNVIELVEDSVRMNAGALQRHGIRLVRDFQDVPPVSTQKHKVLQILVNLIRNAKFACSESGREGSRIILRVAQEAGAIKIAVIDNGVGIAPENMTRIFAHGFTTRSHGHGFGLHSGALAAQELGGSLRAYSEGIGRGATFVLELPLESEAAESTDSTVAGPISSVA